MKSEEINELFTTFENAVYDLDGVECWSARDLQTILAYAQWRNFKKTILKASDACKNSGNEVSDHFVGISKKVSLGSGEELNPKNYQLVRMRKK